MTRILHVSDCYLPRLGGIENHVDGLVRRQRAAGLDARVLTSTAGSTLPWVQLADRWTRDLASATTRGTVLHAHVSVWSPLATYATRWATGQGVPVVVTVHSQWSHLRPLPEIASLALGLRGRPIEWTAVSTRVASQLSSLLSAPVAVLPNALDPAEWSVPLRPSEIPTVCSVLRFARTKRPMALVRVLAEVRRRLPRELPLRATLIGDGGRLPAVREQLARREMDWVTLPGRLGPAEVREALSHSWVYLSPAVLESFGIAALEARAVGLPVVASSRGGVGEFVVPGVNGFLESTDAGLATAVVRLLMDQALRGSMTHHNLAHPVDHDWSRALASCDQAYARAAGVLLETA